MARTGDAKEGYGRDMQERPLVESVDKQESGEQGDGRAGPDGPVSW
jgi:hypothetical protein